SETCSYFDQQQYYPYLAGTNPQSISYYMEPDHMEQQYQQFTNRGFYPPNMFEPYIHQPISNEYSQQFPQYLPDNNLLGHNSASTFTIPPSNREANRTENNYLPSGSIFHLQPLTEMCQAPPNYTAQRIPYSKINKKTEPKQVFFQMPTIKETEQQLIPSTQKNIENVPSSQSRIPEQKPSSTITQIPEQNSSEKTTRRKNKNSSATTIQTPEQNLSATTVQRKKRKKKSLAIIKKLFSQSIFSSIATTRCDDQISVVNEEISSNSQESKPTSIITSSECLTSLKTRATIINNDVSQMQSEQCSHYDRNEPLGIRNNLASFSISADLPDLDINVHRHENTYSIDAGINEIDDNTKILSYVESILNDLTPETYDELEKKFEVLNIEDLWILGRVAIDKPTFNFLYAKLCEKLRNKPAGIGKKASIFRKYHFSKVLREIFRNEMRKSRVQKIEYELRKGEVENIIDEKQHKEEAEKLEENLNEVKRREFRGISFFGELFKLRMVPYDAMNRNIRYLFNRTTNEECLECLCRILRSIWKEIYAKACEKDKRMAQLKKYCHKLDVIAKEQKISEHIRVMIQDLLEFKQASLVTPSAENERRTIDQQEWERDLCCRDTVTGSNCSGDNSQQFDDGNDGEVEKQ
ncbi:unnamed protein product, partial [Rotaria sp. Silwood1]